MEEPHGGSENEAAVRALVEAWADAVRRRDLPTVLRHHSPDILMFDVPPPFVSRGIDAYRKTWDLFFRWAPDPAVFDIQEMTVTAGGEVAFASALMRCVDGEKRTPLDFRLTIGLRKIGSHWVIVHEHHSVPAES